MNKSLLFTFFFLVIFKGAFAQIKIGIQGSVITSGVSLKDTSTFARAVTGEGKKRIGFKAGIFAEMPVTGYLYFNPSLNYVNKGGRFNAVFFGEKITQEYITNHLELPLNLVYKTGAAGGFYGGLGPVVSLGISGKQKINNEKPDGTKTADTKKIKFDGKTWQEAGIEDYHLKMLEYGLNTFAGYELPNGIRFELQFRPDLNNLHPDPKAVSYKNTYLGFTIGCAL